MPVQMRFEKKANPMSTKTKTIKVDYLARVEGEGAMYIKIKDGQVEDVKLKIFEPPRFFEALLRGRGPQSLIPPCRHRVGEHRPFTRPRRLYIHRRRSREDEESARNWCRWNFQQPSGHTAGSRGFALDFRR